MNRKEQIIKYAKILSAVIWIVLFLLLIGNRNYMSASAIAEYSPKNQLLSAFAMLMLYAFKTVSIIFPYKVLQITVGMQFSIIPAFFINLAGSAISFAVGYIMGRFYGTEAVKKIVRKNNKLSLLIEHQSKNIIFFSFFLRTLLFLPLEAVSMYFGAVKANFKEYLLGSILGMLPNIVISTIMCDNLSKPTSPAFLVSVVLFVLISIIAIIWYAKYIKKDDKH
ncbi:TVP38/TMEM64 family protein [Ruminococcus flavefaciens]|uniref:TVP38/TMEM64 family protein n=1 Tax=Ruminococcus flavefaciens TaxID=1265 RepID=UPI00048AFFDA|nr:VTT domain-containing protein [Ruminococcus flavefaciens]